MDNRGQKAAAERYFKQAIAVYDQHNGQRALSSPRRSSATGKSERNEAVERRQVEREIPGVLYNYGRYLLTEKRLEEAKHVLRRAFRFAKAAALEDDDIALIDDQLDELNALLAATKAAANEDLPEGTEGNA